MSGGYRYLGVAVLALCACRTESPRGSSPGDTGPAPVTVRISGGTPTVPPGQLGNALMRAYTKAMPDLNFLSVETPGSFRRIQELQDGTADLAIVLADAAFMAYHGSVPDSPAPLRKIRGIALLHPSHIHLLAGPGSHITSVAALEGRRVGVGQPGSGGAISSRVLMRAFGLSPEDVKEFQLPSAKAIDGLIGGALDAAFIVGTDPADDVHRATRAGARLVDIAGATVDQLRASYPFLRAGLIPGGQYPGHDRSIQTLSLDALLLARAGLDEPLAHRLTSALFEALPQLSAELPLLRDMIPERASATPIPLHPGAALFYREKDLLGR